MEGTVQETNVSIRNALYVKDGKLHLESGKPLKIFRIPKFIQNRNPEITLEQIQVQPVKEEIPVSTQLFPLAEALVKFFLEAAYPDDSKVEKIPESFSIRGRGFTFNVSKSNTILTIVYSRFNGDFEKPVIYRGRWFLNPVRALTLAREILGELKKKNLTYKLGEESVLIKEGDTVKVLDLRRALTNEISPYERALLKSALEAMILSGGASDFAGNRLGQIRVLSPGRYSVKGAEIRITTIDKAFLLREIL